MRNIYDSRIIKKTSHDVTPVATSTRQGANDTSWNRPNFNNRGDSDLSYNQGTTNTRTISNVVLTSVNKNSNNSFLRNPNRSPIKTRTAAPTYTTPDTSFENSYEKEQHDPDGDAVDPTQFTPQSPYISNIGHTSERLSLNATSWEEILNPLQTQLGNNDYHFDEKKEAEVAPMVALNTKQNLSYQSLNYDSQSTVSNGISGIRRAPAGGRIARLATIFSSRSSGSSIDANDGDILSPSMMTPTDSRTTQFRSKSATDGEFMTDNMSTSLESPVSTMTPMPLSPAASSGSSAYVGWPGTQDRLGQTVAHQSSYDDSSVGAPNVSSLSVIPLTRSSAALRSVNCLRRPQQQHRNEEEDVARHSTKMTSKYLAPDLTYEDCGSTDESLTSTHRVKSRTRKMDHGTTTKPTATRNTQPENVPSSREAAFNPAEYHLAGAIADAASRASVSLKRQSFSSLQYSKENNELNTYPHTVSNQTIPFSWNRKNVEGATSIVDRSPSPQVASERNADNFLTFHDKNENLEFTTEPNLASTSSASASFSKPNRTKNPSLTTNTKLPNRFQELCQNADTAALLMVGNTSQIRPPTEKAIAENNLFLSPHRTFPISEGYMGLLDKTKDVPALMDNMDSDTSMSSSKATSLSTSVPNHPNSLDQKLSQNDAIYELDSYNRRPIIRGILRTSNLDRSVISDLDNESDVFDGLSVTRESDIFDNVESRPSPRKGKAGGVRHYPDRIVEEEDDDADFNNVAGGNNYTKSDVFKIVVLPGGLTAIQTTDREYSKRRTASDYDDHLTASEVSSNGNTRIPGLEEMILSGIRQDSSLHGIDGNFGRASRRNNENTVSRSLLLDDTSSYVSEGEENTDEHSYTYDSEEDTMDLLQYRVTPLSMQKLVNKYREMSDEVDSNMSLDQFEIDEDDNKAFALFEMRSRIMASDIERGLERRGGTKVVDDIVTTSFNRASHRIRDAIIVCKAWRDGATISDVVKTSILGRKNERTYYIRRRIRDTNHRNTHFYNDTASCASGVSAISSAGKIYWEEVKWLDDTDIFQYRCPTLGSRHLRGFEMFTVGDCQSILLKLTNERCMELRKELNEATSRQIEAEDMLKEEGDNFHGEMTDAEVSYLTAMEDVKCISKQLVQAEQAFALVHDRIKKLIDRYNTILMKIENNSTVVSYESSCYSSAYWEQVEHRDREMWARRARRAEIRAEISAREAFIAKQEIREIERATHEELEILKRKLNDVRSEASSAAPSSSAPLRQNSAVIAKSLAKRRSDVVGLVNNTSRTVVESKSRINNEKVKDVKQRFRERLAARKQEYDTTSHSSPSPSYDLQSSTHSTSRARELFHGADEEMFLQMDFYERSLQAVSRTRL